MDAAPGRDKPNASTAEVMVDAVPIVMQWPGDEAIRSSAEDQSSSLIVPARSSSQYFHTSDPEPSVWPRQEARSIGAAGAKRTGTPAEIAPMTSAGWSCRSRRATRPRQTD